MTADLAALGRVLSRTALRMRVQRALEATAKALTVGSVASTAVLFAADRFGSLGWSAPLALSAVSGALAACWPVSRDEVAARIDRTCALEGRFETALGLLREPVRSRFASAALRDADEHARSVSPAAVWPLRRPRASGWALLAFAACVAASLRAPEVDAPSTAIVKLPELRAPLLDRDELADLEADLPPESVEGSARFRELVQRVREGAEAAGVIATALSLEHQLDAQPATEDAELQQLAGELRRAQPALSQALREARLHDAAAQLRALAARLQDHALSAAERSELAAALARARQRELSRAHETAAKQAGTPSGSAVGADEPDPEPSLLKKRAQKSPHAHAQQSPWQRELQKLSRELARAGAGLAQRKEARDPTTPDEPQGASDALSRGADALDSMQKQREQREQERELSHAVAQLRELLQKRAARAESGGDAGSPRANQPQASDRGERSQDDPTDANARAQRFRERASGGAETASESQAAQVTVVESTREVTTSAADGAPGDTHDGTRGRATSARDPSYQDLSLQGLHGRGPTRSQVIRSAAQGGFANARYRKVYGDYRAHAEALLERDQVPAGARFHVRRYFELVRPRAGQDRP